MKIPTLIIGLLMIVGVSSAYVLGTNGTSMLEVANFPTDPYHDTVYNDTVYIVVGNEVWAYNVSDGVVLSDIDYNEYDGRIINDEGIGAIVGDGDKLYSIDGVNLKIYDLTTSKYSPDVVGTFPIEGRSIIIDGDYAFVGVSGGFSYLDISNPAAVSYVGNGTGATVSHMAYDGSDWLYSVYEYGDHSSSDGVFRIWNVTDKANPTLYASPNVANWTKYPGYTFGQSNSTPITSISYYNNTVYLAKYSVALEAWDVTDKSASHLEWTSFITPYDIAAVHTYTYGNYLYVSIRYTAFTNYCTGKGGLAIYDISSPIPVIQDTECTFVGYTEDVSSDGDVAVVCAEKCGCHFYNVLTKTSIVHGGLKAIPSMVYAKPEMTTVGGFKILGVVGKDNGIWYYNMTNPDTSNSVINPITAYTMPTWRSRYTAFTGNYSYYQKSENGYGAVIINLTGIEQDGFEPTVGDDYSPDTAVFSIYANNTRFYLHTYSNFRVYDNALKDTGTPTLLSSTLHTTTPISSDQTQMFRYHTNYLIVRNDSGYNVVDITTDTPSIVYYYDDPHTPNSGCWVYDEDIDRIYYCSGGSTYAINTTQTTSWEHYLGSGYIDSSTGTANAIASNGTDVYMGGSGGIFLYDFTYPDQLSLDEVDRAIPANTPQDRGLAFYDGYLYSGGSKLVVYKTTPWSGTPPVLPVVSWSAEPTSGSAPLNVQFTDASTDSEADSGYPYGWEWDFGDGETSTAQNPSHIFTGVGVYNVSLTVNGVGGTNTSATQPITVQLTGADFVANRTWNASPPMTVAFTRIPLGEPDGTSYKWNFNWTEGNATADATTEDATWTYTSPGTYTVWYEVTNATAGESANKTRAGYITVGGNECDQSLYITPYETHSFVVDANTTSWEYYRNATAAHGYAATYLISGIDFHATATNYIASLTRGGMGFNTTGQADGVTDAYISLYKYYFHNSIENPNLTFVDFSPTDPAVYSYSDFNKTAFTRITTDKTYSSIGSGRTNFSISNLSYINNSGITSVLFVTNWDADNTPPTWEADGQSLHEFYRGTTGDTAAYLVMNTTGTCGENLPAPVSDFTATPLYGSAPLSVVFNDTSTGNPTSWNWSFGDGSYSSLQNPSKLYSSSGTYTVNLTATNAAGSDSSEQTITATPVAPVAAFSCDPVVGDNPLEVFCTDESINVPTSWNWTFGDGSDSTESNPSHTYTAAGVYNVSLQAINSVGSDTETKLGYIEVFTNGTDVFLPVAAFTCSPLTGEAPITLTCLDESTNTPTSWEWSIEDTGETSTDKNATMTVSSPGSWNVTLTAMNTAGSDTLTKYGYVTATMNAPYTDFTANDTYGVAPLAVNFTDMSTSGITDWAWYWYDNETLSSSARHPTFVFPAGVYNVRLLATNAEGSTWENKSAYITSYEELPPVVDFSANVTTGQFPLGVKFTDESTNTPTSWNWSFGDGNFSTTQNPAYTYGYFGTYTVNLTATNVYGSANTSKTDYITVTNPPAPTASFTVNETMPCMNDTVQFTDTSTGSPSSWTWTFGDGNSSVLQNPTNTYASEGSYTINMSATNAYGTGWSNRTNYIGVFNCTLGTKKTVTRSLADGVDTNASYAVMLGWGLALASLLALFLLILSVMNGGEIDVITVVIAVVTIGGIFIGLLLIGIISGVMSGTVV